MTKAAHFMFGFCLLMASAPVLPAQKPPTQAAVEEAVRRQANTIQLGQKLSEARAIHQKGDLAAAAKMYEDAYTLVGQIGAGVEAEAQQTVTGLSAVRMQLAKMARDRGDLREADIQVTRVLRVDPKNAAAADFKAQVDKALAAQAGKVPSQELQARVPEIKQEKTETGTLVQDGRFLYEAGKLEEAEAKLNEAISREPNDAAAHYYISLVKQARYASAVKKREITYQNKLVEVEEAWEEPIKRDVLPVPNPMARTNLIYTSAGRQAIVSKLNRIKLDEVFFDGLPLGEVVRALNEEAKKRDPERKGINFIVNPHVDPPTTTIPEATATIDPTTGLPIPSGFSSYEPIDMNAIAIKINPSLNDIRLADVLDAVVKVAERPIKYSIEDYAVVFSFKSQDVPPIYSRTWKVDPNTFYQGLESVGAFRFGDIETTSGSGGGRGGSSGGRGGGSGQGGDSSSLTVPRVNVAGGGGGQTGGAAGGIGGTTGGGGLNFVTRREQVETIQQAVRNFFISAGVDLNPPKNLFFNERAGVLTVRASLQDLDIVESAVQTLNVAPPQVTVQTKFVEITQDDTRALGFDWSFGNLNIGSKDGQPKIIGNAGTAPSYNGPAPFPQNVFPNPVIPRSGSDQVLTAGLRNQVNAPAVATLSGILTDPQFRVVIRALEQRGGVELMTAPSITTLSGRQAQIQVVDIRTIVTGVDLNQTSSGSSGALDTTGGGAGAIGSTVNFITEPLPFGPVLDVIPYVSADGYSIQMTLIPTVTEFVGYDDPAGFIPQAQSVSGGSGAGVPLQAQLPLPVLRMRQVTTSAIVWDGQTIVLGGLLSENIEKTKDKVPVLGDMPLVGRFFRSESSTARKKNLVIFVTPTIIDPAGNRVHQDEDLPFAQRFVPTHPVATE